MTRTQVGWLVIVGVLTGLIFGADRSGWAAEPRDTGRCPERALVPPQLRLSNCSLARAAVAGLAGSTTFRRLVDRIGALRGIVYVDARWLVQPETGRTYSGALEHRIVRAGDYRLLYVLVAPEQGSRPTTILAHELQHAVEVLQSDAGSEAAVDALFKRIGVEAGAWAFETGAAVRAQRAVARELAGRSRGRTKH